MMYLLVMAAVCGVSLWFASRTNRAARARHDSVVSMRRDLELLAEADVERADQLVQAYAEVLQRRRPSDQPLRRASDLPASKEQIGAAMFTVARYARTRAPSDSKAMETLVSNYSLLGEFVPDELAAHELADQASIQKSAAECARRREEITAFLAEPPGGAAESRA